MADLDAQFRTLVATAQQDGAEQARRRQLTDEDYRRGVALRMTAQMLTIATGWLKQDSEATAIISKAASDLRDLAAVPLTPMVPPTPPPTLNG